MRSLLKEFRNSYGMKKALKKSADECSIVNETLDTIETMKKMGFNYEEEIRDHGKGYVHDRMIHERNMAEFLKDVEK